MNNTSPIRVILVDGNPEVRSEIGASLLAFDDLELVGEAGSGAEALQMCELLQLDVVLIDTGVRGMAATVRTIRRHWPRIQVIALTSGGEKELTQGALDAGATGHILKNVSAAELADAIRTGHAHRPTLRPGITQAFLNRRKPVAEWYERFIARALQEPLTVALALVFIAAAGVLLVGLSTLTGRATPTLVPGPSIRLSPSEGGPGALIVVTGGGWQAGDTVFVRLDSPSADPSSEQEGQAIVASAPVAEDGRFTAPFFFPSDASWSSLPRVQVTVWSPTTGDELSAMFQVMTADQTQTPAPTATLTPTLAPTPSQTAPTPTLTQSPVVQPTATPTPQIAGWRGEYYANRNLTSPTLVRDDAGVNFDWGTGAPATGLPADGFSVRWTRTLSFREGAYRFSARSDDGVRLWLDEELIIDEWHDGTIFTHIAEKKLGAGTHTLRIEYYENRGAAKIQLWWERAGDFPQWRGEYFPSLDLTGASALVRNDSTIAFDWGRNAPSAELPVDAFSARWTRILLFEGGMYRFHALVDDGMRLYADNVAVLDDWRDGGRREVTADYILSAGDHSLRVEYYERTGDALIQVWWEKVISYPDWRGEYWPNRSLSGSSALVRNDVALDFDWGRDAPAPGIPVDNFSARWTRTAEFDAATYRFHVTMDDGARLWVDEQLTIDDWNDGAARERTADYTVARGAHSLRVEFYENTGEAQIHVWWEKAPPTSYPDWKGEYWSNRHLDGDPALVRNDKAIDFHWGAGAPAAGLPMDNFSARWSRQVNFQAGVYGFYGWADDGLRLYVDGNLALDEWHTSGASEVYVTQLALTGEHQLEVHYYEHGGEALVKFWWIRIGDWPTPTSTPTPTPEPTPTPTPMPTQTWEPTPTPTLTPEPTSQPTPTPSPTWEPTPAPTHTPEPMSQPTLKPTQTVEPTPQPTLVPTTVPITSTPVITQTGVRLNEILPVPVPAEGGPPDEQDEWIELHNAGSDTVDLGGWFLDDGDSGEDSMPYLIPEGTVMQPGAFALFYGRDTGIVLDDGGDDVRLIGPDGIVVDSVTFGPLAPTRSYSRDEDGVWHDDWPPSLGAPNQPPVLGQAEPPAKGPEGQVSLEKLNSTSHRRLAEKRPRASDE